MADSIIALAAGLSAVFFLLLLIGLTACLLWKKKQGQRQYHQLISTNSTIPLCTPVLQTTQESNYGLVEVPFFLPPRFESLTHSESAGRKEDEERWEQYLQNQRGSLIVGNWFPLGSLRPDLYHLPEEPSKWVQPSGSTIRLCFAVQYQQEQEQLTVSLLQAFNLPTQYQRNATLVKLQLLPSEDRHFCQAKARFKGCQPQFNDSFVFQLCNSRVDHCTLSMKVCSVDRLRKHHVVGHVLFPLKQSELHDAAGKILWRDLKTETESDLPHSKQGNIQVSLNYTQSLQRLTVVVLRACGLECPSSADVFVQASLQIHTQVVKTKFTSAARGHDPTFNETLTFRLLPLQLDTACLSIKVLQQTIKEPASLNQCNKTPLSLGLVVIGPFMYARGRELEHWNEMISNSPDMVKQWHGLRTTNTLRDQPELCS